MLSAWWILSFALAVACCSVSCYLCVTAVQRIRRTVLDLKPALRMSEELQMMLERVEAVERSNKRLHSRAGMREVREKLPNTQGEREPDWRTDPQAYIARHQRGLPHNSGG